MINTSCLAQSIFLCRPIITSYLSRSLFPNCQLINSLLYCRRGLEVGGMLAGKGGREGLLKEDLGPTLREGSDGETSDYQRSTPSPRDADDMVLELNSEGWLSS